MTNPLGPIAGLATAAVKGMLELCERKYGKWGEVKVKRLEAKLLAMAVEVDALHAENEKLTASLKASATREKILLGDIENMRKQVDILEHLRVVHRPVEENPYK